jgi:hypothetical protein
VRASPGTVGYLGNEASLTVLNPGDTPPAGMSWDGFIFRVNDGGGDRTYEDLKFNGSSVTVFNTAATTFRNCVFVTPLGSFYGLVTDTGGNGTVLFEDLSVRADGTPTVGADVIDAGISTDCVATVRRCRVSGMGDGIHANAVPGTLVTQCAVLDPQFVDEEQHLDDIQIFNIAEGEGEITVEHCYTEPAFSPGNNPINSSLTCGLPNLTPPNDTAFRIQITLDNNFWGGGDYMLRCGFRLMDVSITNNDWGAPGNGFFDYFYVEEASTVLLAGAAGWDNNRDEEGALLSRPT